MDMNKPLLSERTKTLLTDTDCYFSRVATLRGKYLENEIFSRSWKSREFYGWPGKFRKGLESQGKVREFENKWLWQADFRKFILFKRGKDGHALSHEII